MRRIIWIICVFVVLAAGALFLRTFKGEPRDIEVSEEAGPDALSVEPERGNVSDAESVASVQENPVHSAGMQAERLQHQADIVSRLNELQMSSRVRDIIAFEGDGSDRKARYAALAKLTREMSQSDVDALMLFFDMRFAEQNNLGDMKLLTFNAIKNNALEVLVRQKVFPDGLGNTLVEVYQDEKHDDVWRDYCVQYMHSCYANEQAKETPNSETLKILEDSYWQAAKETDKTIAGTSILALERLSHENDRIDRDKLAELVVAMASDDQCGEASRITALRTSAKMGRQDVLPSARVTAQAGDTVMLRMAAIATLGDIGETTDMELLESLSASSEKRISDTAQSAYDRLSKKLTDNSNAVAGS